MNGYLRRVSFVIVGLLGLFFSSAHAQVQVGLSGNYLGFTREVTPFSDGPFGGGLTLRYFISPRVAVGFNGRYLTRTLKSDLVTGLEFQSRFTVSGLQVEYFLSETNVRPYIGLETNYFLRKGTIRFAGSSESVTFKALGIAPKAGVHFMFNPTIGLDVNAGYHRLFSEGNRPGLSCLAPGWFFNLANVEPLKSPDRCRGFLV